MPPETLRRGRDELAGGLAGRPADRARLPGGSRPTLSKRQSGRQSYPDATAPLIGADGGGSNGSKPRPFKPRLREFADETGLAGAVSHDPPGASKWNPVEHRWISRISATWAGVVLSTVAVLVGLIRRTTTATGRTVTARVMPGDYPTGRTVTAAEFQAIKLTRPTTCPQWNDAIHPRIGGVDTA